MSLTRSELFLNDIIEMFKIFSGLNPPESVVSKYGLPDAFAIIFQKKFPLYDLKALALIAKTFVICRTKLINSNEASKTLRARKKQAEYIVNA